MLLDVLGYRVRGGAVDSVSARNDRGRSGWRHRGSVLALVTCNPHDNISDVTMRNRCYQSRLNGRLFLMLPFLFLVFSEFLRLYL